jgi:hypothetical protein
MQLVGGCQPDGMPLRMHLVGGVSWRSGDGGLAFVLAQLDVISLPLHLTSLYDASSPSFSRMIEIDTKEGQLAGTRSRSLPAAPLQTTASSSDGAKKEGTPGTRRRALLVAGGMVQTHGGGAAAGAGANAMSDSSIGMSSPLVTVAAADAALTTTGMEDGASSSGAAKEKEKTPPVPAEIRKFRILIKGTSGDDEIISTTRNAVSSMPRMQ